MKLWAISDLHVGFAENRRAVEALEPHPDDWLIVAGDTGESVAHLELVLRALTPRFAQIIWTPGNHDLWTPRSWPSDRRGAARYQRLVDRCRRHDVLTPEDHFAVWPGSRPRLAIVPVFLLYDYTFGPNGLAPEAAVEWAAETGVRCADEDLLAPDPFESRSAWCRARVEETEQRLAAIPEDVRIVLVTHFPLRQSHAVLPRIPRFSIWCGTRATDQWHRRYPIEAVIYGHLHIRQSRVEDGVRFEEVSLGYPGQWDPSRGLRPYLRQIL